MQIWVPLVNCLEPKPGYDDFCEHTPPFETYTREAQPRALWFYQSCASHGCNVVGGPYFTGWPSYMIDVPGAANRVMQWIAWKYRIEGELYYSVDEAYGRGKDPWESVFLVGGNGDGTLFYPGRPDHIGGHTDIPIESIRLKLIREGMEDYEYLALLAKLGGAKWADEYADRIVKKPYLWESQPEAFLKVRQELGEALDRSGGKIWRGNLMRHDATGRMVLEVKQPLLEALSYLSSHSSKIHAAWRKLLKRYEPCGKYVALLSGLHLTPQVRDLRFADPQAYREKSERQGQDLARSGVPAECVAVAVALYVESCLPYLMSDGFRESGMDEGFCPVGFGLPVLSSLGLRPTWRSRAAVA